MYYWFCEFCPGNGNDSFEDFLGVFLVEMIFVDFGMLSFNVIIFLVSLCFLIFYHLPCVGCCRNSVYHVCVALFLNEQKSHLYQFKILLNIATLSSYCSSLQTLRALG